MKKVSLADVAKSLGVSKTLVSLVLNGKGDEKGINKETQKRVLKKVKELNYKPNQFARGLRIGKSNTIGLIVADISNQFYALMCRAIEDKCNEYGYNLIICSSDEDPKKESQLIQMLLDKQADGLIISTTLNNTKDIAWLKEANFPFVLIDRKIDTLKTNYVGVDNIQGAFEAVNHLIKTGHKKIAHLTLNTSHLSSLKERITGYKNALKHNQIKFKPELIKEVDFDNILNDTKVVLKELLNPPYSIDAIFTANNNLTVACLEVLNELKIRIPQDVALVGFDDIEAFKLSYPPVTTVVQPIFKMSQYAVDILIDNIKNTEKFVIKQKQFENRLEIRKSCGYKHKAPKI